LIKVVTFDLWNTIISDKDYLDRRVKCLTTNLSGLNILRTYNEVVEAYIASHKYVHKIWRRENYRYLSADERLKHILEGLSAELSEDLRMRILKEFEESVIVDPPLLIEGVKDTLELLHQKYDMGIISDTGITPGRVLRKILRGHQILRFFEVTVFSDEIGYNKPHRIMFETALTDLKAKPSEAIHTGDLLQTDIAGAKAIGMKTVWFNRKGEVYTGPNRPDHQIKTFPELIGILSF